MLSKLNQSKLLPQQEPSHKNHNSRINKRNNKMCRINNTTKARSLGMGFLDAGGNEIIFDKTMCSADINQSSIDMLGKTIIIISIDHHLNIHERNEAVNDLDDDISAISLSERLHAVNDSRDSLIHQGFNIRGSFSVDGSNVDIQSIGN